MMFGDVPTSVRAVPERWSVHPFGSLTSWVSGGTPPKSNSAFWEGAIPWISAKSLKRFYLHDSEDHVTEAAVADGARLAEIGDVLMLVRGMTLHNDVPVGIAMRPMTFNQDVKGLRGKDGADTRFISYWLVGNKWRLLAAVDEASHGTGRLRTEVVQAMDVMLPPLDEQRAIASVLGVLDDKIEQNRRTAQALEELARAIFRAWFVDFEPVKAKAAGATGFPSMPQPVFDALPTRFVDSDIGPVPEGWSVSRLDEVLTLQRGFDLPKQSRTNGAYPIFAASGINGWHSECKVKGPGVTTGRSGVLGQIFYVEDDFWPLNTSLWVKEYKQSNPYHAYFLLQTLDLARFNSGSAVPTLNRNHVHSLPVAMAAKPLLDGFADICRSLFDTRKQISVEDRGLTELRDYLLPKLLSGSIRVSDAERQAATVA